MKINVFFANHPVFTTDELRNFLVSGNPKNYYLFLNYYLKNGRIVQIRRRLYAVVPFGMSEKSFYPNSFLIAGKCSDDSVLAYHTALEYYGRAYSIQAQRTFLTSKRITPFDFDGVHYKSVRFPASLVKNHAELFEVVNINVQGLKLKITSVERTLVDALDRFELCGGIEEVWRSIEMIEFLNFDLVFEYLNLLNNVTTFAKVGFFLEKNRVRLDVEENFLDELKRRKPKSIHYFDRSRKEPTHVSKEWNLAVPVSLWNLDWEE